METMSVVCPAAVFSVRGYADPGTVPRVLELFAQRGLIPRTLSCRHSGEDILIDLEMADIEEDVIDVLLNKIRQIVLVDHAEMGSRER